ncbi:MAG: S41 family peptidase [Ignavibacteriales bacterium]|nr:S41 family peptidase [Ignavibacteriales bacterium]
MKKKAAFLSVGIVAILALGFVELDNVYFSINKNIDVFGRVYKEIVTNYVDEVDPEKFMRSGIDGMLETLDPYTVYLGGKDEDEIDLLTHGQYGGIGVSIGVRDGIITILSPMEGYSAHKQGVRAGDRIIEIDGTKISGLNPDSVRSRVRGEPGTIVKMKVEREGEKNPIEFVLVREEIQVHNVGYSGYVKEGIGYIKLERFSRRAGEEVRQAIKEMKVKGDLKGIILDIRDNPGGLLDAAVEIVSKFVPQDNIIVTTKGRKGGEEKEYKVEEEPLVPDVPIAVIINKSSASASEIVAGALQDLDRGIIVGTRSFGKGLVQTVVPLTYNSSMKITTARYYTPSGRCIQEIDYLHKNKDGVFSVTPDSLKREFKTKNGRIVKELGGISPDTSVENGTHSGFYAELMRKAMFFKFATSYVTKYPSFDGEFVVNDDLLKQFEEYIASQKFDYTEPAEKQLTELKDLMKKERYSATSISSVEGLLTQLQKEKTNAFVRYKEEIRNELSEEINGRYNGEKGRTRVSLNHDSQVQLAASLLMSKKTYDRLLKPR